MNKDAEYINLFMPHTGYHHEAKTNLQVRKEEKIPKRTFHNKREKRKQILRVEKHRE